MEPSKTISIENGVYCEILKVLGFMEDDMHRMISEINPLPNSSGNCNFPITLYVFSCIEYLGFLTSTTLIPSTNGYSNKRIISYINDFFDKKDSSDIINFQKDFVRIFRNGIAHEFFPKAAGISRNSVKLIYQNGNNLILDADLMAEAFIKSIHNLKSQLDKNIVLKTRMIERHLAKLRENNKYFDKSKYQVIDSPISISGASLSIVRFPNEYSTSSEIEFTIDIDSLEELK